MASAIMHIDIAKKVKEKIEVENEKDYYLGSIAPDLAKQIGDSRDKSHFSLNTLNNLPDIDLFTKRYPLFKFNSFDLGYFTHLYADKVWSEDFLPHLTANNSIKLLDGTIIETTPDEMKNMIYSDFTNLNIKIIEEYDLDLSLFYEEFSLPNTKIQEVNINKLDLLINKMGILIENSKETKAYTFDIYSVEEFIEDTAKEIVQLLKKY